jgi:hypothetical protein
MSIKSIYYLIAFNLLMTFQSYSQFTATEFISFVTVEGIYTLGHWDIDGYLQLAEGSEDIIVVKNKDGEIIPVQDLCLLKTSTGILLIRSILEGPAGFHVTDVVDIWGRTFELYFHHSH